VGRMCLFQMVYGSFLASRHESVARAATLWPPAYRSRTCVVTFESRGPSGEKLGTGFERIESCWVASRPYAHDSLWLSKFPSCTLSPTIDRCIPIETIYLEKHEKVESFQVTVLRPKNSDNLVIMFLSKSLFSKLYFYIMSIKTL